MSCRSSRPLHSTRVRGLIGQSASRARFIEKERFAGGDTANVDPVRSRSYGNGCSI
jgi:hypothetical protein